MCSNSAMLCHILSVLFTLSILWQTVRTFNLDDTYGVVKKTGPRESYFGYSIAQHIQKEDRGSRRTPWILVGAPLGQNLQPNVNGSGALYRCPVNNLERDCQQVPTDGQRKSKDGVYYFDRFGESSGSDIRPPGDDEIKENQWLGVTVRSQGDPSDGNPIILVCAHRYIKAPSNMTYYGLGLCYSLTSDFALQDAFELCAGRSMTDGVQQWAFCQSGVNGCLVDDDTAIVGVPGTYTMKGTVFSFDISDDYLMADKTKYFIQEPPVDKYSYMGFGLAAADFFNTGKLSVAAGAPRSEGVGEVVFAAKVGSVSNSDMETLNKLKGEVYGSQFGYELASADINNDGFPDLIVGAPFYYAESMDKGGAIYVYLNVETGFTNNMDYSQKITGEGQESRFGFAITNMRDINNDGYEDIAVGAPYKDNGVVYIYLGSASGMLELGQVITAETVDARRVPRTFGYSLSGGVDLDNNGYPDLAVGAYVDDAVFVLRGRPIIGIKTSINDIDPLKNISAAVKGCSSDPGAETHCFSFKTCFILQEHNNNNTLRTQGRRVNLLYTITAETHTGKRFSRVYFKNPTPENEHVVNRTVQFIRDDSRVMCLNETAYLRDGILDIHTPIKFRLEYQLANNCRPARRFQSDLLDLSRCPILNRLEAVKDFEATFEKDCGTDGVCESNLFVDASFRLDKEENTNYYNLILSEKDELIVDLEVTNTGDPAYESVVFLSHPDSLSFIGYNTSQVFSCNIENATLVKCDLGNPMKEEHSGVLSVRFSPASLHESLKTKLIRVYVNASTASRQIQQQQQTLEAQIVRKAELKLVGNALPEVPLYGEKPKGESAIKYLHEVGTAVEHVYQISNAGPSRVTKVDVVIQWPFQVNNGEPQGKWLLYMTESPFISNADGECVMKAGQVNYLGLSKQEGISEGVLSHQKQTESSTSQSNQSRGSPVYGDFEGELPQPVDREQEHIAHGGGDVYISSGESGRRTDEAKKEHKKVIIEEKKKVTIKNTTRTSSSSSSAGAGDSRYSASSGYSGGYNRFNTDSNRYEYRGESENVTQHRSSSGPQGTTSDSDSWSSWRWREQDGEIVREDSGESRSSNGRGGHGRSRFKREKELRIKAEDVEIDGKMRKVVKFNCEDTAKCTTFHCTIRRLGAKSSATIRIPARIWNATLVEDYGHVFRVDISSNAVIQLGETSEIIQNTDDDTATATTEAKPNILDVAEAGLASWIIAVAVLGGLLLLFLVVFILYKCGFFKRKRHDQYLNVKTS